MPELCATVRRCAKFLVARGQPPLSMRCAIAYLTLFLSSALMACTSTRAPDVVDTADEQPAPDVSNESIRDDGCPIAPTGGGINCRSFGDTCTYEAVRCHCDSGGWQCDPIECPTSGVTSGASCPRIGLTCGHYFEGACDCVGPELVWNCCGGAVGCQIPVEGARCCRPDPTFCRPFHDGGVTITGVCSGGHWTGVTYTPDDAGDVGSDSAPSDVVDASATE